MEIRKQLIAYHTIMIKEVVRVLRIWTQSLVPPIVTMTLYFIIFGKLIGSQIRHIDGFTYMQYITPGLIMMPIITASYANTVSSFFMAKFQHSVEEMLVSPTRSVVILLGYISGGMFRGILIGVIVTFVSLFFTQLHMHHVWLTFVIAILCSLLFSLAGFMNAIFATRFDDVSFIPNFILTPLTYLGGIFYSIKLLPPFWQRVSMFNPILHIVNAFRFGILGISDINIYFAFGIIIAFIVVLFSLNLYFLHKGIGIRE